MNNDELATRRAQAIAEDRCFSKGRLRDEFRMKPAPGAEPAYSALFDHGLASKSDQRFASIRSTGNLTFSTAF